MRKLLLFVFGLSLNLVSVAQQFQHLKLTSMCSDDPTQSLRWRVKNQNSYPVTYSWRIVDGGASSPSSAQYTTPFIAQPGDNYFFSPTAASGNNVMVIYVNNVEQNGGRKASGKQICSTKNFDVFVSCVKKLDPCTYQVTFGYRNDNPGLTFTIPHGNDNRFTGGSIIRGESDTVFYPGIYNDAFKIRIGCNTTVVWHLKGPFGSKSVNTTAPNLNQCVFPVKPYVNCIKPSVSKPGVVEATFGYQYDDNDTITIPAGADNMLTGALFGNAITQFFPGKHDNVFTAEFTGASMEWHLKDYTNNSYNVKAFEQYAGRCLEAVRPHVKCIIKNNDETTTAFFTYENNNSSTETILKGSRNYLVGESGTVSVPETFYTGFNDDVFSVTFTGKELKWILLGPDGVSRYAVANDEYCKICDEKKKDDAKYISSTYPNPSQDQFNLNVNAVKTDGKNFTIQVCDAFGKVRYASEFTSNTSTISINLAGLPSGVYSVNLICEKEKECIKMVKQ